MIREVLPRYLLFYLETAFILVRADRSTSHYLDCLHESQCQKAGGSRCCPTGTCCNFFQWQSSKIMSHCKRIRPGHTAYCQDRDKIILNDDDLLDHRFLTKHPPNRGVLCVRRPKKTSIFCFGGTDSEEEEFKAQGIQMTARDGELSLQGVTPDIVRGNIKDPHNFLRQLILAMSRHTASSVSWSLTPLQLVKRCT